MADAVTAAKERIDRAILGLERKLNTLRIRNAGGPAVTDDDLFAPRPADAARVAELEQAGREASEALQAAADAIRDSLAGPDKDAA